MAWGHVQDSLHDPLEASKLEGCCRDALACCDEMLSTPRGKRENGKKREEGGEKEEKRGGREGEKENDGKVGEGRGGGVGDTRGKGIKTEKGKGRGEMETWGKRRNREEGVRK